MDAVMDAVECFRSGLLVFLEGSGPLPFLGLLPFILFLIAFSVDKLRIGAYRLLDDEEEPSDEEMI